MEKMVNRFSKLSLFASIAFPILLIVAIRIIFLFIFSMLSIKVGLLSNIYTYFLNESPIIAVLIYCTLIPYFSAYIFQHFNITIVSGWHDMLTSGQKPNAFWSPALFSAIVYGLVYTAAYCKGSFDGFAIILTQFFLIGFVLSSTYIITYEAKKSAIIHVITISILSNILSTLIYFIIKLVL